MVSEKELSKVSVRFPSKNASLNNQLPSEVGRSCLMLGFFLVGNSLAAVCDMNVPSNSSLDSQGEKSSPTPRTTEYLSTTELNPHTNFGQVKVLKVVRSLSGAIDNYITFEAFSHTGVASVFIAEVTEFLDAYEKLRSGLLKLNTLIPIIMVKTLKKDSLNDVAPYISQYALAMYNIFTLHVKKDVVHDTSSVKVIRAKIHDAPSLKVVKGKKHEAEDTTYLVTFEASLRDERKKVETFETKISVPTLFPTLIIQFKEIQIKHD
ncbi:hypothetical protein OROMI_001161 [Orobanche minor]